MPESTYELEESFHYAGTMPDEGWFIGGRVRAVCAVAATADLCGTCGKLIAEGHAYRCYCTKERLDMLRTEQQARNLPTGYDRHCRNPEARERMRLERLEKEGAEPSSVVRLAMPLDGIAVLHDEIRGEINFEYSLQDDQVLLKSDGFPTYFLACTVDDHLMVSRTFCAARSGCRARPKCCICTRCSGWDKPKFAHLPVIVGTDKKKLAKRHGSTQVKAFMEAGLFAGSPD